MTDRLEELKALLAGASITGGTNAHPLTYYVRECLLCPRPAILVAPVGLDDLDVEAEFSSQGRALGDDDEVRGFACRSCADKLHRQERRRT